MRQRVIIAAMLAFLAVIVMIAVLVNITSYIVLTQNADRTVSAIRVFEERPDGEAMPSEGMPQDGTSPDVKPGGPGEGMPGGPGGAFRDEGNGPMKPFDGLKDEEANYMTRFFVVRVSSDGSVVETSRDYIASVDESKAAEFADMAMKRRSDRGYIREYRFHKIQTSDGETAIIFLNASREKLYMRTLLILTLAVSFLSLVIVFILVTVLSGRAIRPIASNIKQQKQFITDASHELKTPLTSISTSLDVLSMEHGEDEWIDNIRKQTGRMSKLVSELVTLSRLDEDQPIPDKEQFSLSNAAWEIAEVYKPQAKAKEKTFDTEIADDILLTGDKAAIQQMLSVLLDNAIRYSDEKGTIRFAINKKKNRARIEVFNTCFYEIPPDTDRLFDRFYRPDSSRSTETGGTGVGLAIAKAVALSHGGSIEAKCPDGKSMTITILL